MNTGIEKRVKQCATCLGYQHTQPQEKTIPLKLPAKPCKIAGADIFSVNNETLLCIVEYYSNFPVMKRADRLSADDLIIATNVVFTEFGLPKKLVLDAGTIFVSDLFKQFCGQLNTNKAITTSYYQQNNEQVEACIKFVDCAIKNALITIMMSMCIVADNMNANRHRITYSSYTPFQRAHQSFATPN